MLSDSGSAWEQGSAASWDRASPSLLADGAAPLAAERRVVLLRHGTSTWNAAKRIQGSSNESCLTDAGRAQAQRCAAALTEVPFDACFASDLTRSKETAEIVWQGRQPPVVWLPALREANLRSIQGMTQADAFAKHPREFTQWRDQPATFCIDGAFPVLELFQHARAVWQDILERPGSAHLVISHKSVLRALTCTALGLPPGSFRAVDINNGGITEFRVNPAGEAMLISLNCTAHMHHDGVAWQP